MKRVHVRVPATTANLGPGFDALGLALDLWNEAIFELDAPNVNGGPPIAVSLEGEGAGELPGDESNAIAAAASQVFGMTRESPRGLRIHCINRVPLGSGLGSSSAAMLTGMLGANALLGEPFSSEQVLKLAIEAEGHPDNVAPAMLGGLVASIVYDERVISLKLPARAQRAPIQATVVLPDFDFPTQAARAILPVQVARQDAIYNISRAVLVTEALRTGDLELLGQTMTDSLHQPYRLPLIPGAQDAIEAARRSGAAAVALSGAGPSLIAFSSRRRPDIGEAMRQAFAQAGMSSRVFLLKISRRGAETHVL